ncbi:MAG: methyl-accepting chemotaxis protein [Burkholderiales bacterium]
MDSLRRFGIGSRLAGAFGCLLVLLCVVAGFGATETSRINDNVVDISANWLASVQLLGQAKSLTEDVRRHSLLHVLDNDPAEKARQQAARDAIVSTTLPKVLSAYEKTINAPDEQELYESIKSAWGAYLVEDQKLLGLSNGGESSFVEARKLAAGGAATKFAEAMQAIDKDIELNAAGSVVAVQSAADSYRSALIWDGIAVAISLTVGAVLAVVITRSITRPIQQAVNFADTVAKGDLSSRIDIVGNDEPARLLGALSRMNTNLADIVSRVRNGSDSISTGANEIATGNADLSQRTEEQAANLQQTAASMEQMTATVKNNADTARRATQLASAASEVAAQGGAVVEQVIGTMDAITASSKKISDIIGVIDGIAFQTNILALNAAVEAARAGEQGRGFAVVATEVRNLAQRSASAAKEIKGLITHSVEKVQAGGVQVNEAGRTMLDIVEQVKRVSVMIGEISAATDEQTQGLGQVGDAVTQLDQVTQQNAALVEQSAAAADSLRQQARNLVAAMSTFTLATA